MNIRPRLLATLTALTLPAALLGVTPAARAEPPSLDRPPGPSSAHRAPGTSSAPAARGDYEDGAVRRVANLTDAAPGADPGRSVRSAVVTQDLVAQRITARVTLGAVPAANAVVYVALGTWSGSTCDSRAVVASATTTADRAGQVGGAPIAVSSSRSGAVLTITSAASGAIRAAEWECAFAFSTAPDDSDTRLSVLYADDLVTQFVPRLVINRGAPIQGSPRGRWTTVELDLHNDGRADAAGTVVRLSGAGLAIKPRTRSYGTLEDRSSEYFEKFKVRLKGSRPRPLTITMTAAGGHRTTAKVTIVEKPKPKRVASLVGRYYWGHKPVQADRGWDNVAVRFVSKRLARVGFSAKGAQPCRKRSSVCRPYSYDARRGTVRVQGLGRGAVTSAALKLGKQGYYPLTVPRAGAKVSAQLIHQNFEGICGIYCTTWTEWITMDGSGRFVRSRQTIGSIGPPGVGTIWAGTSPDQRGRYQVLARGKVRFSYADGTTRVHSIGIGHDVREKPSPAGAGIVLDDVNFYLD